MNLVERAKAPTPRLFRVLRTIGLVLVVVGGSIVAAPITLPTLVIIIAGYVTVAGGVLSAVSQITVDDDAKREHKIVERLSKDNENLPRDGIR
jgi:uncharacterized membrane protein HdeD (DUF308 family)